jgi:REP element-mobilizing transposase RayT
MERSKYTSGIHQRHSLRLPGFDYSSVAAYFVTICVDANQCLLGEIENNIMVKNTFGNIVENTWHDLPSHTKNIRLDEFIVMPNHIHGIIFIIENEANLINGENFEKIFPIKEFDELTSPVPIIQRRKMILSKLIGRLKMVSAKQINQIRNTPQTSFWKRNYYDHIIRDHSDLNRCREYIINNPQKWAEDRENSNPHP